MKINPKTESMHLFERKDFLMIISAAMIINPVLLRATKKLILVLFHPVTTIIDRVIAVNNAWNFTSLLRSTVCDMYKIMVMFTHVCLSL